MRKLMDSHSLIHFIAITAVLFLSGELDLSTNYQFIFCTKSSCGKKSFLKSDKLKNCDKIWGFVRKMINLQR